MLHKQSKRIYNTNRMTSHTIDDVVSKVEQAVTGAVSGTIRRHFHGLFSDYTTYKQTHDAILSLPAVKNAILSGGVDIGCGASVSDTKEHQSQDLIQCLETIEELQEELRTIKLENAALRLQLETKTYAPKTSTESEPENITLIIEEKEIKQVDTLSSDLRTIRIKPEPLDDNQYENYMDTQCVEERECSEEVLSDTDDAEDENVNECEGDQEEEEDNRDEEEDSEIVEKGKNDEEENKENDVEQEENQGENEELAVQTEIGHEEKVVSSCDQNEDSSNSSSVSEPVDSQDSESEEVEVFEIEIKGKTYFTTDEKSGIIYACLPDGDIGDEIGMFVNGKPTFHAKQKK